MRIVDDAQHAARFPPVVGEIRRQAGGYAAKAPIARQREAPGVDELSLRVGCFMHQHALYAKVGLEGPVDDLVPVGRDGHVTVRFHLRGHLSRHQHVQREHMPHVDEIFDKIKVAVGAKIPALDDKLAVGPRQNVNFRQRRRVFLVGTHVAPDKPAPFPCRVPQVRDLVLQNAVAWFERRTDTAAAAVECPAVVGAGQPIRFDLAVDKRRTAMRAPRPEQANAAVLFAIGHQVFAQHAHGVRQILQIP